MLERDDYIIESVKYDKYTYFYRPLLQAILMKYNSTGIKKFIWISVTIVIAVIDLVTADLPVNYGMGNISQLMLWTKNLACGRVLILLLKNEALVNFSTKIWSSSQSSSLYPSILSLFLCGILTYTNVSKFLLVFFLNFHSFELIHKSCFGGLAFFFFFFKSVCFVFFTFSASSFPASTNYPRRTSDLSCNTTLSCSSPFWCSFPPYGTATPHFLTPSVFCLSNSCISSSCVCSSDRFLSPSHHNCSWH